MPHPLGSLAFTWPFYVAAFAGYLLGSIPFGLLLTRLAGLGDIRNVGSGNIGATNVLRTGNKALAALTLLLDGGKGAAAVLLAGMMGPDMAALAGAGAVVGHLFPIWLRFKGGKGVATGLGVLLASAWPVGLAACATWLLVAALSRYSSLAALLAFLAAPLYAWLFTHNSEQIALALLIALLVWLRHAANIRRLVSGREPKIGAKR
jgi:acyl phosphate:glycerol-3-phosphate acyltransferase